MPQESMSIDGSRIAKPIALGSQGGSLKWKITASFSGLILLLGVLVIAIVYYFTSNALQKQVDLRSVAIATNLSDASAGYVSRKSSLERSEEHTSELQSLTNLVCRLLLEKKKKKKKTHQ